MAAARAAIATIPRFQETPNSPRIAVDGTMLSIHLDLPTTQSLSWAQELIAGTRYSLSDFFSGSGGSSLGALWAGLTNIAAYNHWPEAVACHAVNIPGRHYVADLNLVRDLAGKGVLAGPGLGDPAHGELFGYTDLVWNSAPCRFFTGARRGGKESKSDTRTDQEKAEAAKKARGSMFSALDFVEAHRPLAVITENVVDLHRWPGLRGWLQLWEDYGYVTTPIYLNSMFVGPPGERTPQSRDRVYYFHILKQYADKLDVRYTPEAECLPCRKTVLAEQTWKNGRTHGKYGTQYVYTCPTCHQEVHPATRGLDTAIDLSDMGTPIAERRLGLATRTRIENGLKNLIEQGLPAQPLIVTQDRSNQPEIKPARPWTLAGQTLTGRQVLGVVTHPALLTGSTEPARSLPGVDELNFRMVGPRELSNIAGFPPNYLWVGSKRDVSLATGNAVTPRVAQWAFERIVAALP